MFCTINPEIPGNYFKEVGYVWDRRTVQNMGIGADDTVFESSTAAYWIFSWLLNCVLIKIRLLKCFQARFLKNLNKLHVLE